MKYSLQILKNKNLSNVLPQMHWTSNIFGHSATTIGGFWVSLNYPILNFKKTVCPKNVWMQHWTGCSHWLFLENTPCYMFDKVLNMPLDYLSCFVGILRAIPGKVDICQTDYNIHSKLRIFPCSEVIHESATFKQMKG